LLYSQRNVGFPAQMELTAKGAEQAAKETGCKPFVLLLLLCLASCSSPRYALKPDPVAHSQHTIIGGVDFISSGGTSANLLAAADVLDFFGAKYLLAVVIVSNVSAASFDLSYDALELSTCSGNATTNLAPLEPDNVVKKMAEQRRSHESSQKWGTALLALAAARHDPGGHPDVAKVNSTVENNNAITRSESQQASDVIRSLDTFLLRRRNIEPMSRGGGYVVFPFFKADSYKLHLTVAGERQEFRFLLRSY
jgi:hypothetical protein